MVDAVRVLAVDDREVNLLAIEAVLDGTGVEVLRARSAEEALRVLLAEDLAMVILDVRMPGVDGLTLLREMRTHPRMRELPVAFVTAEPLSADLLAEAYSLDAFDVLVKPFDPVVLRARVSVLATLHRQKRQIHAHEAAEAERLRLHTLLHQLPAAIAILRGEKMVYELSNAMNQRMLGNRDVVGKTIEQAVPELAAQGFGDLVRHVYRTGEPFRAHEMPAQLVTDDGVQQVFLNGGYEPLRGPSGEIEGVLGFAYEVTELVLARQRAEASEARFRRLHDSGVIGVVFWTRDGRLTDANDAFLRMVGYTRDELKSGAVDWRNMTPPEWNPLDEQAFAEMERTGICTPYEKEYLHKDGRRVPILLGVAFWEGSTTEGVAWIVDQTERNAAMERERDARAAAESAVRKRDEFLSIASHELKTPLTSLSLNLQSLERTVNEKAEGRIGERVDRMRAQLARLTVLVDQLLDVGRLERGLPPRVGEVDLVELARSVLDRFDDESRATDTPLVFHAPATLKGLWDRDRLDQVFTNLISNAVKYGRGAPVEVELASTENSALLSVRDHGIGIPRTEHARIFERFERASSARNYGGLGLGLWITREIVSAHGGTMEVESDTGRGATFRVVLPRTA